MRNPDDFGFGTQIRKSLYFDATVKWGAKDFSVYNHMYIPRDFVIPEENFWNLVNDAILCDVAVERQVEITGPDASRFAQLLTPRDLSTMAWGQCKYVLITNAEGGIINDPIMLRLDENRYWISLADSDVLLWAQGVAVHAGLDVQLHEPDASPLQLQGPRSQDIMAVLFGENPRAEILLAAASGRLTGWTWWYPEPAGRASWAMRFICRMAAAERSTGSWRPEALLPEARAYVLDPPSKAGCCPTMLIWTF